MKPIDTNISKGFEHKICQFGRLEYAMEKRGIDALVITQPLNVFYLSGFIGIAHKADEPRPYAMIYSRQAPKKSYFNRSRLLFFFGRLCVFWPEPTRIVAYGRDDGGGWISTPLIGYYPDIHTPHRIFCKIFVPAFYSYISPNFAPTPSTSC